MTPSRPCEPANIANALDSLGTNILEAAKHLGNGDACTEFGALEAFGMTVRDAAKEISGGLGDVASALREIVDALHQPARPES